MNLILIAFSRLVRYDSYLLLFPNILIMKPHSIAFRQKIIEVHEVEDISQRKLAKRFNVALSFIQNCSNSIVKLTHWHRKSALNKLLPS
jgi:Trp operon repressor